MCDHLEHVLNHLMSFEASELKEIVSCFRPKTVSKGHLLLSQGDVCQEFYFVHRGCIRTGFYTRDGQEKTRYLMCDSFIGTALASFIAATPSFEFIDAVEDSELLVIHRRDFYRLRDNLPAWKHFYERILEMAYCFQNKRLEQLVTLSAQQRYEQLMTDQPFLAQRVSNKVLASYLDMSPETLSRLKSK